MMWKASLLAFVGLLALACAAPSVLLGGSLTQFDGVYSPDFAAFNTESQTWSTYPRPLGGTINSLAAVRNGTFAVGTFTSVGNSQSRRVAFWDGVKWCPIRQGLNGDGRAVVCDSDTSCWVAGTFTGVFNLDVENELLNFVHYEYNTGTHEWEIDVDALNWNNATADPLGVAIDIDELDYIGSGSNLFFFAKSGNEIYRGSAADNGWFLLANIGSMPAGATEIRDWSLNPEGTSLFVVTDAAGNSLSFLTGTRVTAACGGSCDTPTQSDDWDPFTSTPYNATLFLGFSAVAAGPSDTRYLIGLYDPDGLDSEFVPRQRVLQQVGTGQPTLVGDAFDVSTSDVLTRIGLTETNGPLVMGTFTTANLFYPTTPSTTDNSGVVNDRRPLDLINGLAVYDSALSRWVPFGGGGVSGGPSGAVRMTYNSVTEEWFLADDAITWVYDKHAGGLIYHETTEDAFFPVLTRSLVARRNGLAPGEVYTALCETSACSHVLVGGDFAFHGADTFGSILRAAVQTTGEPQLSAVGGGLWQTGVDHYLNDTTFQVDNGEVYALAIAGGHLYAGGGFSRTAPSSGFHCLNNIARISTSNLASGQWESLEGGCDDYVYDLKEYSGRLYVGGEFARCADVIVNNVASYSFGDETPAWHSLNNGVDDNVYSLEVFQGRLIAGGEFTYAGGLPATGVASWDGSKWRALLPACTDDCVPGGLDFYFSHPVQPHTLNSLQRDSTGDYLFATGAFAGGGGGGGKRGGGEQRYLVRWHYTEGDFGQWQVKGQINRNLGNVESSAVANFVDDQILVVGTAPASPWSTDSPNLGVWDKNAENNDVAPTIVADTVAFVLGPEGGSGSASALSSMLSPLLAYVF